MAIKCVCYVTHPLVCVVQSGCQTKDSPLRKVVGGQIDKVIFTQNTADTQSHAHLLLVLFNSYYTHELVFRQSILMPNLPNKVQMFKTIMKEP